MVMKVLPPGFRFHPTDVELLMYYLKRKILGRALHFEAIQEVSIYKLDPWDLPSLSCLKTDDQKWYFFCPRERRYAHGDRAKRSTGKGFWKTTGRDRPVMYNDVPVGMIKTLIFHEGRAPQGTRTDWVMHEYRLEDPGLAGNEIPQDSYVLCAIFKKKGLGPRNGAQYGAPFREEDWEDDGVTVAVPSDMLTTARGSVQALPPQQEKQQDHCPRNQDVANKDLSESIAVIGSPPPVLAASEMTLPEPSGAALSSATTVINHANEVTMVGPVNDPNAEGMDIDELWAMIDAAPVNNNNQETQAAADGSDVPATIAATAADGSDVPAAIAATAADGSNVSAAIAPTGAEGNGIFAGLPDLDVGLERTWSPINGFGFGHHSFNDDEFMELLDLEPQSVEAHTPFFGNIQGAEVGIGNVLPNAEMHCAAWLEPCRYNSREKFNQPK